MISSKIASLEARLARLERLARQKTAKSFYDMKTDYRDNSLGFDIAQAVHIAEGLVYKVYGSHPRIQTEYEDNYYLLTMDFSRLYREIGKVSFIIERPQSGLKIKKIKMKCMNQGHIKAYLNEYSFDLSAGYHEDEAQLGKLMAQAMLNYLKDVIKQVQPTW
jgi:hypothetical protein